MGKAPAFQFYAQDFLIGVAGFSLEEIGAYIVLLAVSWEQGPLPLEEKRRAILVGVTPAKFRKLWRTVGRKWTQIDAGYVNLKLEQVRTERAAFSESQAARAAARWARVRGGNDAAAVPGHSRGDAGRVPGRCSSVFSLQSLDQTQDQEQRADARPAPIAVDGQTLKVLTRLAHDVLDADDSQPDSELAAELKHRASQARLTYDGRHITKALESARAQRVRA